MIMLVGYFNFNVCSFKLNYSIFTEYGFRLYFSHLSNVSLSLQGIKVSAKTKTKWQKKICKINVNLCYSNEIDKRILSNDDEIY